MASDQAFEISAPKPKGKRRLGIALFVLLLAAQTAGLGILGVTVSQLEDRLHQQEQAMDATKDSLQAASKDLSTAEADLRDLETFKTETEAWVDGMNQYANSVNEAFSAVYKEINNVSYSIPDSYTCDAYGYSTSLTCTAWP